MINRFLPYAIALLVMITIFTIEENKPDKEELPTVKKISSIPTLELSIEGLPLEFVTGQFNWVSKGTGVVIDKDEPPVLFKNTPVQSIKPFSKLQMNFSKEPRQAEIAVIKWTDDLEDGRFIFEPLLESTYTFNNFSGKQIVVIRGFYDDQEVHYTFPINIEKVVSYQNQLAEEKGGLAILEIYDKKQHGANWALDRIKNSYIHKAQSMSVVTIDEARSQFPDLDIKSLPYYAIFDHEKVLYQVYAEQEFFKLIPVVLP